MPTQTAGTPSYPAAQPVTTSQEALALFSSDAPISTERVAVRIAHSSDAAAVYIDGHLADKGHIYDVQERLIERLFDVEHTDALFVDEDGKTGGLWGAIASTLAEVDA